ncbi:hypothetical protein BRYFOR_08353 [Marvinbryantia formatexigens DSM 14469]|uniref:Uncharacterized protein n=1 Tax=Marvinbryantia formatexigens DSM 14469 TaxID=478749 RepID=C6LI82_9FIRM|nr:hypothetical protein [Marvinbryantia formatexigens]EET59737.1 hypothetical protein BRYFOR_08353 [Marvinbryantia formatexigens DSM 14469]UWO26618.1 hypothetical protein NQ534_09240 [Marvinbryantia formatexigens DSM 14469]
MSSNVVRQGGFPAVSGRAVFPGSVRQGGFSGQCPAGQFFRTVFGWNSLSRQLPDIRDEHREGSIK